MDSRTTMLRWRATLDRLLRNGVAGFGRDRRGAAAVEFALLSVCLIFTLFFCLSAALVIFMRMQLDFATNRSARQVLNGTVQKNGYSATTFQTQVVCSYLSAVFNCPDVIVNLQTVTEGVNPGGYYPYVNSSLSGLIIPTLNNGSTNYSAGVQGSYEYLQVIYPITFLPSFVGNLLSNGQTYNGTAAYLAVSTAAFRNEQY